MHFFKETMFVLKKMSFIASQKLERINLSVLINERAQLPSTTVDCWVATESATNCMRYDTDMDSVVDQWTT